MPTSPDLTAGRSFSQVSPFAPSRTSQPPLPKTANGTQPVNPPAMAPGNQALLSSLNPSFLPAGGPMPAFNAAAPTFWERAQSLFGR